jgi:hypothetical protein
LAASNQRQPDLDHHALAVPSAHDDWRRSLDGAAPWLHRYLVARSDSDTDAEAVRRARVSVAIVEREAERNPAFAALRAQAVEQGLILGPGDGSRIAREAVGSLVLDAIAESRGLDPATGELATTPIYDKEGNVVGQREAIAPRDRLGNRRMVIEAGEGFPQRAGGAASVTINAAQVAVQVLNLSTEQLAELARSAGVDA